MGLSRKGIAGARHSLVAYTSGHLFHQRQGDYLCDWLLPLRPAHAVDSQIPFFRITPTILTVCNADVSVWSCSDRNRDRLQNLRTLQYCIVISA